MKAGRFSFTRGRAGVGTAAVQMAKAGRRHRLLHGRLAPQDRPGARSRGRSRDPLQDGGLRGGGAADHPRRRRRRGRGLHRRRLPRAQPRGAETGRDSPARRAHGRPDRAPSTSAGCCASASPSAGSPSAPSPSPTSGRSSGASASAGSRSSRPGRSGPSSTHGAFRGGAPRPRDDGGGRELREDHPHLRLTRRRGVPGGSTAGPGAGGRERARGRERERGRGRERGRRRGGPAGGRSRFVRT